MSYNVNGPQVATGSSAPADALLPSIVRTVVPLIMGLVITGLLRLGIDWGDTSGHLTELVTSLVTAVYYIVIRFAETHLGPQWGWLLGLAKAPAYSATGAPSPGPGEILRTSVEVDPQAVDNSVHNDPL